jgi:hypothetical protein
MEADTPTAAQVQCLVVVLHRGVIVLVWVVLVKYLELTHGGLLAVVGILLLPTVVVYQKVPRPSHSTS